MYKCVLSVCTSTSKEYILEKVVFFIGKLSSSLLGESRHTRYCQQKTLLFLFIELNTQKGGGVSLQSKHRGRVEIGGVYLPSQMERTPQLCTRWYSRYS